MRDYKFRGYRLDGKGWVYGSLNTNDIYHRVSIKENGVIIHGIYPESIGQYIGVKTPNTYSAEWDVSQLVELYEGDIVEAFSEGSKATFCIKWREEGAPCFILYPAWQFGKIWRIHGSNRDGHIYDNLIIKGTDFEQNILYK